MDTTLAASPKLSERLNGSSDEASRLSLAVLERSSPPITAIIVTASSDSIAGTWFPSTIGAVLVFEEALLLELLKALESHQPEFSTWLHIDWLVFDLTATPAAKSTITSSPLLHQPANPTLPEGREDMRIRRFFGFERNDTNPIVLLLRDLASPDFAPTNIYLPVVGAKSTSDMFEYLRERPALVETPPTTEAPATQRQKSSSRLRRRMK